MGFTSTTSMRFLLLLSIFSLIYTGITSLEQPDLVVGGGVNDAVPEADVPKPVDSDSSLKVEVDQLKSKITHLESTVEDRTQELKSNEKKIKELEKTIEEKSNSLASLQSQVKLLQEKASMNAKEQEGKAQSYVSELQEQINHLKKEVEQQKKEKDALATRANTAEKGIQELNLKLESLQRTSDEQKSMIRKTQRALEVAEEELMKAKLEASSISKQLAEVHGAWIPPWLEAHFIHFQSFVVTNWDKHGKPALEVTKEKALEKKTELEKRVKPHIETFKSQWVPIIKERWLGFVDDFGYHIQSVTTTVIDKYHVTRKSVEPHVLKLQEVVDPYFQDAKRKSKPFVDQVSSTTKPHVDKALVFLKPYTDKVHKSYRKFAKRTSLYHRQIQATILDTLKDNDFTRPLATKQVVWFMASALMALPVIVVLNMVSAVFRKKPKKHARNPQSSNARRRTKRAHSER